MKIIETKKKQKPNIGRCQKIIISSFQNKNHKKQRYYILAKTAFFSINTEWLVIHLLFSLLRFGSDLFRSKYIFIWALCWFKTKAIKSVCICTPSWYATVLPSYYNTIKYLLFHGDAGFQWLLLLFICIFKNYYPPAVSNTTFQGEQSVYHKQPINLKGMDWMQIVYPNKILSLCTGSRIIRPMHSNSTDYCFFRCMLTTAHKVYLFLYFKCDAIILHKIVLYRPLLIVIEYQFTGPRYF